MSKVFFAFALLLSETVFGGVLTVTPGPNGIEGVVIGQSAVANVDGNQVSVDSLGAGLYEKKIAILKIKAYVGQVYGDVEQFVRTNEGALNSLTAMPVVAVQMTFLRDVDVAQVETTYTDGFAQNKIDVSKPEIKRFLRAVANGGDVLRGKTVTVVGVKINNGTEGVVYENSLGVSEYVTGPAGFVKDVMALWLGSFTEKERQVLKEQILRGN